MTDNMKTLSKHRLADLDWPELENGKWLVKEQLHPESRGYIPYYFDTEGEAQHFFETGKYNEEDVDKLRTSVLNEQINKANKRIEECRNLGL